MAIVGAAFLLAVVRALARIDVEHDNLCRSPLAHLVDPLAGKIGESGKVLGPAPATSSRSDPSGWPEAPEPLIARSPTTLTHRRVAAQPLGVVHVLVASHQSEERLTQ
jgi:hypothetical protein